MSEMQWVEVFRGINVAGSLFCLYLLSRSAYVQWHRWNAKTQQHWWALLGWVFLGVEGSLEQLLQHTPSGPRVFLTMLVIAWTIRALLLQQQLKSEPTRFIRKDKNDEA